MADHAGAQDKDLCFLATDVAGNDSAHFFGVSHTLVTGTGIGIAAVGDHGADRIAWSALATQDDRSSHNLVLRVDPGDDGRFIGNNQRDIGLAACLDPCLDARKAETACE